MAERLLFTGFIRRFAPRGQSRRVGTLFRGCLSACGRVMAMVERF